MTVTNRSLNKPPVKQPLPKAPFPEVAQEAVADPGGAAGLAAHPQWKLALLRRRRRGVNFHVHWLSVSARGCIFGIFAQKGDFLPVKFF